MSSGTEKGGGRGRESYQMEKVCGDEAMGEGGVCAGARKQPSFTVYLLITTTDNMILFRLSP